MVSPDAGVSVMTCPGESVTPVDQSTTHNGAPLRVDTAGSVMAVAVGAARLTTIMP